MIVNLLLVFFSATIVIIVAVGINLIINSYRKSKELRLLGYEFLYYYMNNCRNLLYYRSKDRHISIYKDNYDKLVKNKYKLYVVNRTIIFNLIRFYENAEKFTSEIHPYFLLTHYFSFSECEKFVPRADWLEQMMKNIVNEECKEYVKVKYNDQDFSAFPLNKKYEHQLLSSLRPQHNNEFVEKELRDHRYFFDTVLAYPLDSQQRESIVRLEDNCLVISSAGSGKTSTAIAKVKYLIDERHLNKQGILVLSYNRKTSEEFEARLGVHGMTCKTFHSLARTIIGQVEGRSPDICDETFLLSCYYELVRNDNNYKKAINRFVSEVSSLTKGEHEYKNAEEYFKDRETYGIMAPYGDMNGSPVFTKSEEEKKICTWLSSHGVHFLYEQPYPIQTADTQHRQYKPDFTIYFNNNGEQQYFFLEHFGIDRNGNVPQWFGDGRGGFLAANRRYHADILWKRQLHQNNNTTLIETTSAMFHDGTIFNNLERKLRRIGVPIRELSEGEKYSLIFERNRAMEDNVMNLFTSFISLMKSNGKTFQSIMNDIVNANKGTAFNDRCKFLMFEVIKPLYDEYEKGLRARNQVDYTDLILKATKICNSGRWRIPYSYILVDEFQDISIDRYKFLLSLRNQEPLTKTYCVGDDWQSIYRFSGSDINLFNHFEKYFGFTERCKIETTYRFGNPLVERSSAFILKNPIQVQKEVRPYSQQVVTNISFIPFSRSDSADYLNKIQEVLAGIPADESVMLLARYNYEVEVFPRGCVSKTPNSKRAKVTYANRVMDFMSVHAAKGLEADHVLILNCSQDSGGFPSRETDDPILGYVLSEIDTYEYSEERRLFYVAISRARKHTYILYNDKMPSVFVTEMLNEENTDQMICPQCKRGRFKMIRDAVDVTGHPYRNYVCSNSIAGCRFFWQVFSHDEQAILRQYHIQMDRYFQ